MTEQPGQKYAFLGLTKALSSGTKKTIRKWRDVLAVMQSGDLQVGNRAPVSGMPVWATPEVARGGFATAAYLAGGKIRPHENALAKQLDIQTASIGQLRLALNNWHLSDEGLATLREQAVTGRFHAETAEETALLCVALLLENDPDGTAAILNDITPFFDRLRFYPAPSPKASTDSYFVHDVAETACKLRNKQPSKQLLAQTSSINVWIPLYDRLVDLLAETDQTNWNAQADAWLTDYDAALEHIVSRRWQRANSPFQRCRKALIVRRRDGELSDSTLSDLTTIIQRRAQKYGSQQSRAQFRMQQACQTPTLWFDDLSKIMIKRLAPLRQDNGIEKLDAISGPISAKEASKSAPENSLLPKTYGRILNAARVGTIDDLISCGQISAPEILASVLPQMTANIHAAGFPSKVHARTYSALYRAFQNRRSLLLLNYQQQVQIEELPWAKALLLKRDSAPNDTFIARDCLTQLVQLSLTYFPHVIFPNKLIEEMAQLAKTAGLNIPMTRELTADIFMGGFSKTFAEAADQSLQYYAGTLYARYYDLPASDHPKSLAELCQSRAGVLPAGNWSVAANGRIIEQQQIITSHNLAQLMTALDLRALDHTQMVRDCFAWICRKQQTSITDWRAKLQMTKNTAYAWRQMIAFLSELPDDTQQSVFAELSNTYRQQSDDFQNRFAPALTGLLSAVNDRKIPDRSQVFLGWVQGKHPFAPTDN